MPETEQKKDSYVTLINFAGKAEQVVDFSNHVEELLSKGWTRPEPAPAPHAKKTVIKTENE